MKKKVMKKADGGGIGTSRMPSSVSLPASARVPTARPTAPASRPMATPSPNAMAMQRANANSRIPRPVTGGPLPPVTTMKKGGHMPVKKAGGGMMYTGGSKDFDETTGTYRKGKRPAAPSGLSRTLPSQAATKAGEARSAALARFQGKRAGTASGGTGAAPMTAMKKGGATHKRGMKKK